MYKTLHHSSRVVSKHAFDRDTIDHFIAFHVDLSEGNCSHGLSSSVWSKIMAESNRLSNKWQEEAYKVECTLQIKRNKYEK